MEEPSDEWEIQEYSSLEGHNIKLSWIFSKGLNLGRKIAITGIVISSAPLVLPPLVVISALGFALSVPFGVVFASYACTEKLMSKLLPSPESHPMLDYGTLSEEEEVDLGGDIVMEEEEEQMEDMKGLAEMRIEMVEKGRDEVILPEEYGREGVKVCDEKPVEEVDGNVKEVGHEEEIRKGVDGKVKEEGYEEDVGEYLEGEDDGPLEVTEVKIEGMGEEEEEELVIERITKGEQSLVEMQQVVVSVERDDKNSINVSVAEELDLVPTGVVERGFENIVKTQNGEEDLVKETTGFLEKLRDERNVNTTVENVDSVGVVEKPIADVNATINGNRLRESAEIIEEQRPMADKKEVKQRGETKNQIPIVVCEGIQMEREKVHPVISNSDAREIADESGSDLFEDRNEAIEIKSYTVYENSKELTLGQSAEFLELSVSAEAPELQHAGNDSEMHTAVPPGKSLLREEKLWEHIDALRTIVGYKAARHSMCIEELKALYIFTGVEPPASFKNRSDLVEVNEKLQFLMSIVGVK